LLRHRLEYDITLRYLEKYLPNRSRVLEIGAATGRYTLTLAQAGHSVTAVDVAPILLNENRRNIESANLAERVTFIEADARDLSRVTETDFDAVLLMGPLYHLVELADRRMAVYEAYRHLRPGGFLFSAFISRFGIMADIIKKDPAWIMKGDDVQAILNRGRDLEDYPKGGFRGYFCTPSEILPLHEEVGIKTIALAAVEPGIGADDESYNLLDEELRKYWLDLFFQISTETSLIGASRHLLYIGEKPK
jgi:SAM-dependent methyltransferase